MSPSSAATSSANATSGDLRIGAEQTTNIPVNASSQTVSSLVSGYPCPTLRFMIGSYLLKTSTSTKYSGGTCSNIKAGSVISFTGTRVSNSEQVIYLDSISFGGSSSKPEPEPTTGSKPEPTPASGLTNVTISSLVSGYACPDLRFYGSSAVYKPATGTTTPSGYLFKTSTSTKYEGGTCAALKAGLTVALNGTKLAETTVMVTHITFTTPVEETYPFEADVKVDGLATGSSCPYLQFTVGDKKFTASKTTQYDGGHCEKVRAGSQLQISGERRKKDDLIMVSTIVFKKDADDDDDEDKVPPSSVPVTGESVVGEHMADTKCPTLNFKLGSHPARVTETTTYLTGSCSDITPGATITYFGEKRAEGLIVVTHAAITAASGETDPAATDPPANTDTPAKPTPPVKGKPVDLLN